jgi:hypothetical protein
LLQLVATSWACTAGWQLAKRLRRNTCLLAAQLLSAAKLLAGIHCMPMLTAAALFLLLLPPLLLLCIIS